MITTATSTVATTGTHVLVNGVLTTATHGAIDAVASGTKMTASLGISVASWLISTAIIGGVKLTATGAYHGSLFVRDQIWGSPTQEQTAITETPSNP